MRINYIDKHQDYPNETTNFWFDVSGTIYAISDCNGELSLLDIEGRPVDDCNDGDAVKEPLIHHYKMHISG